MIFFCPLTTLKAKYVKERRNMIPTRRRRQQIMDEFGFSPTFMDVATKKIRGYPERYPNAIIRSGKVVLFDYEMFLDWIKYRNALAAKTPVPPFRREDYR